VRRDLEFVPDLGPRYNAKQANKMDTRWEAIYNDGSKLSQVK